jgi:adenine/guanine phosphoribosyltransferase-like PRPP-binding protein
MISPVQKRGKGPTWWLRKKMPLALRKVVGRAEVWRSVETAERREANTRCAVMSANLEIEWARLQPKLLVLIPTRGIVPAATLSREEGNLVCAAAARAASMGEMTTQERANVVSVASGAFNQDGVYIHSAK